jgi:hypothetical protein
VSSTPSDPTNVDLRSRAIAALRADRGLSVLGRPLRPDVSTLVEPPPASAPPQPPPAASAPPQPTEPTQPVPLPPVALPPQAPPSNPFTDLAFPSPGDRIKAEDFRRLSQALRVLSDTYALAGAVFGFPFGQVKLALAAQQYEIAHVVSVYGSELTNLGDPSLDDRRVLAVAPLVLGERRVSVVLSEQAAAGARPTMLDLKGLTYAQAQARLQSELGDVLSGGPVPTPDLRGLTLTQAMQRIRQG